MFLFASPNLIFLRFGGPTIVGEWSIADTDCAPYINSIGEGYHLRPIMYLTASSTRWEGTYTGAFGTNNPGVPGCALASNCSCTNANAQPSAYSTAYKTFLADYFIAQVGFYFVECLPCRRPASSAHGDG